MTAKPSTSTSLRPRARSVLRMLAVHTAGVHRQALVDEFWPGDDETSGAKKLHVAISAIRRVLDRDDTAPVLLRRGELYVLSPDLVESDLARFRPPSARPGRPGARRPGRRPGRLVPPRSNCTEVSWLPEEGAAEWVVAERQAVDTEA